MELIFHQLFDQESSTYTYFLASQSEAIIIDSVLENVDEYLKVLQQEELQLKFILDTHVHADHITGAHLLREKTGAKIGISSQAQLSCADLQLEDGDQVSFGQENLAVIHTPGHTNTCVSFYIKDRVFTGDALLIEGCGRTDFQEGDSRKLFHSIREKIFQLPDPTTVYPGHDYKGRTHSTVGHEKQNNPRLGLNKTEEEFVKIMSELNLPNPKKIHQAVPANLQCGVE